MSLPLTLYWKAALEIGFLWLVFYMFLLFIKGTHTEEVLKGIFILLIVFFVTQKLQLDIINWILTKVFTISVIAFLIIFQPELRRALARIGRFGHRLQEQEIIDEVIKSATMLSTKKIGALVIIEREIGLKIYVESGIALESKVTAELINTIFMPNTPLHDGAVIIQAGQISAAGCLLPLSQSGILDASVGTRHRAALGIAEETDAVALAVSEETGAISIAANGRLNQKLDVETAQKILANLLGQRKKRGLIQKFIGSKT